MFKGLHCQSAISRGFDDKGVFQKVSKSDERRPRRRGGRTLCESRNQISGIDIDAHGDVRFGGEADIKWIRPLMALSGHWACRSRVTGSWEIDGGSHSALMLRVRMRLPHFSVSSPMSLPKLAGESAMVGKPRLVLRIGEAIVDFLVELVDDLGGRGLRCTDAVPAARLITW